MNPFLSARFAELFGGNQANDRVRGQQLPKVGPTLDYVDEAFTSENWIVSCFLSTSFG
jgi:dolichyl-diphosphooligosaccharide--protein glycosyltransferase